MNPGIFTTGHSCHERGLCQRTTSQCRRACHLVDPWQGEPPIGYEAARASNVHQLHADRRAAERALAASSTPQPAQPLYDDMADITRAITIGSSAVLAVVLVLALIGWTLTTDGSAAHAVWQWLQQLGRAVMSVTS